MVNVLVAYALLLAAGPTGLHLAYVRRPRHAALWGVTGGLFLVGLVRDLLCLPRYVREANGDPGEVAQLQKRVQLGPPPATWARRIAQVIVGAYLGGILCSLDKSVVGALHVESRWAVGLTLQLVGVVSGVWLVGGVGAEYVPLGRTLLAGALASAVFLLGDDEDEGVGSTHGGIWLVSVVAMLAGTNAKSWRPNAVEQMASRRGRRSRCGFCWNIVKLYVCVLSFLPLLGVAVYNYGELPIKQDDGVRKHYNVKFLLDQYVQEHMDDWVKVRAGLGQLFEFVKTNGFQETFQQFREMAPQYAEGEALRVLGLPEDADTQAIRRRFRKLSVQFHPDRQIGASEEEREAAAREYEQIVKAYEVLTNKS